MARRHVRARSFHGNRDGGRRRDMFMCPRCGRLVKAWRWCCDECWARIGEPPPGWVLSAALKALSHNGQGDAQVLSNHF